jgi:hypothetical protein
MVLPDSCLVPLSRQYLRANQRRLFIFAYRTITVFGMPFQALRLINNLVTSPVPCREQRSVSQHLKRNVCRLTRLRFRLIPFRSPLLRKSSFFLFVRVLRCFSSPPIAQSAYEFSRMFRDLHPGGFPHSEIAGSKLVCSSSALIAAYHALHRLLTPNHPPEALSSLTKKLKNLHSFW